jgi:outer membrane protein, heavy metal efflux system
VKRRGAGKLGKRLLCCSLVALGLVLRAPPDLRAQSPTAPARRDLPLIRLKVRAACPADQTPLAGLAELTAEATVEQVLARSPTFAQMVAAWQAAEARYPQVTSLDDPMFNRIMAPGSAFSNHVDFAYRLELSQKLPWPGKRQLRGQNARALAAAAGCEVEDVRLRLIESARRAFFDYYLVFRALEVNDETVRRLGEFKHAAEALYRTPPTGRKISQQDILQADVEIGRQQERRLTLGRMLEVAVARINTLMHLPPDGPLPPPPRQFRAGEELPDVQALRAGALARRPDLHAASARVAAEEAALALAMKEFYPDFDAMLAYDGFWQSPQRSFDWQVGVRMNLPVRRHRLNAAVAEAQARIAQRRAEWDRLSDQARFEVQQAHAKVHESAGVVQLYEGKLLRDADLNVQAARKSYETGLVPAVSVIEAERTRLALRDRYYEAVADYFRRLATLERAAGGSLAPWPPNGGPCPQGACPAGRLVPVPCGPSSPEVATGK